MIELKSMHLNVVQKMLRRVTHSISLYELTNCIGDQSTHFQHDIVYQQQHNSRVSNACLLLRSDHIANYFYV